MIFLETERLLFRTHEPGDETDFISMHTDSEVQRYVGGQAWTLEKAQHRFQSQYLGQPTETYGLWATILKEEQERRYIGCCGLRGAQGLESAHLGYYFAQPYWGRGFATEAAKAFIDVAFGRLGLLNVVADVEKRNLASEHILQKLAFRCVGREEIPRSDRVILSYELSRGAWERKLS